MAVAGETNITVIDKMTLPQLERNQLALRNARSPIIMRILNLSDREVDRALIRTDYRISQLKSKEKKNTKKEATEARIAEVRQDAEIEKEARNPVPVQKEPEVEDFNKLSIAQLADRFKQLQNNKELTEEEKEAAVPFLEYLSANPAKWQQVVARIRMQQ